MDEPAANGNLGGISPPDPNLWFLDPAQLDHLGPVIGRGAVWLDEPVKKDALSDSFLFSGYDERSLHLAHDGRGPVAFTLEVDRAGNGTWTELRRIDVPANGYVWTAFPPTEAGAWIRVRASRDVGKATALFSFRNADSRVFRADARFDGLGTTGTRGGLLHARGAEKKTLALAFGDSFYEMGPDMQLRRSDEDSAAIWMNANVAPPRDALGFDAASVIYTDEQGKRWRLPRGRADFSAASPHGVERTAREVVTERDILNAGGTFFELPAENAGGVAKVRPIATHNRHIHDFASWRGMMIMSGVAADAPTSNPHILRSTDNHAAVWVGAIDDLWSFGKPVGVGGPWKDTVVTAQTPSDPYLLTGYDKKSLTLSHRAARDVRFRVEVDLSGTGTWVNYATLDVPAGQTIAHAFPAGYQAYWLRITADTDTTATAWLTYD